MKLRDHQTFRRNTSLSSDIFRPAAAAAQQTKEYISPSPPTGWGDPVKEKTSAQLRGQTFWIPLLLGWIGHLTFLTSISPFFQTYNWMEVKGETRNQRRQNTVLFSLFFCHSLFPYVQDPPELHQVCHKTHTHNLLSKVKLCQYQLNCKTTFIIFLNMYAGKQVGFEQRL